MPRDGFGTIKSRTYAIFFAVFLLSGCAALYPDGVPRDEEPAPPPVVDNTPIEPIEVRPLTREPWDFELPGVAIVLTSSQPASPLRPRQPATSSSTAADSAAWAISESVSPWTTSRRG